jgi:ankyrin repeat protein
MILLKQRAHANAQDIHGMTPVHYVAFRGQNMRNKNYYKIYERILENLVNFGARFDIQAKDGSLPLLIA